MSTNEMKKTDAKPTKAIGVKATRPEHVVRDGSVAALIWKRESSTGFAYYEFSLSRSWKSVSTAKEGYSQNFFSKNEAQLAKVMALACQWITAQESKATAEPLAA